MLYRAKCATFSAREIGGMVVTALVAALVLRFLSWALDFAINLAVDCLFLSSGILIGAYIVKSGIFCESAEVEIMPNPREYRRGANGSRRPQQ